jgi:hypothetical protein
VSEPAAAAAPAVHEVQHESSAAEVAHEIVKSESKFYVGDHVEADYRKRGKYYKGVIDRDRGDNTFDVFYDDGEIETRISCECIRSISSSSRIIAEPVKSVPVVQPEVFVVPKVAPVNCKMPVQKESLDDLIVGDIAMVRVKPTRSSGSISELAARALRKVVNIRKASMVLPVSDSTIDIEVHPSIICPDVSHLTNEAAAKVRAVNSLLGKIATMRDVFDGQKSLTNMVVLDTNLLLDEIVSVRVSILSKYR